MMISYMMQEWLESLPSKIHVHEILSLTENDVSFIASHLPKLSKYEEYKKIYQLGPGIHHPCIYDLLPRLSTQVNMKKSCDGKTAQFYCETQDESKIVVREINSKFGKYGYKASSKNNLVTLRTSPHTSISQILSNIGLVPLYWKHDERYETIVFAEPYGCNGYDLRTTLESKKIEFREKFGCKIEFPEKISTLQKNLLLPDIKSYSPAFMEFLIKERARKPLLMTYMALYNMAEIGIPLHLIKKRDLIKIIHAYNNTSIRTLEKQLTDKQTRKLKDLLKKIFSLVEPPITLNWKNMYDINPVEEHNKEYFFDMESRNLNEVLSFNIKKGEITCEICNLQNCKHVVEIYQNPEIKNLIAKRGIKLNTAFYAGFFQNMPSLIESSENASNLGDYDNE